MTESFKCADCGAELNPVRFVRPLQRGQQRDDCFFGSRDMLCEPCWNVAYRQRYGHDYQRAEGGGA